MAHRLLLCAIPVALVIALVELVNWLEAGPGVAVAALGLLAVSIGTTIGFFADRLPELPWHDSSAPRS
jgi:hypothetical protein